VTASVTLSVTFDAGGLSGTYSYVPENGGLVTVPQANGARECFEPTASYTFQGVRTSGGTAASPAPEPNVSDGRGSTGMLVWSALALAAAGVAGGATMRVRRRSRSRDRASGEQPQVRSVNDPGRQSVTPSGPSMAVGIRAVLDTQPRVTIEPTTHLQRIHHSEQGRPR